MRPAWPGWALALVTAGISGVAIFLNSYGVRAVGDATVYTTAKNLVAAAVLLLAAGLLGARRRSDRSGAGHPSGPQGGRRQAGVARPAGAGEWVGLTAVAVLGGSLPFLLFFTGLAELAAGATGATLIHKTLVVWVVLLAVPLLRERVGWLQWLAIGALLAGQLALAGGWSVLGGLGLGRGELLIAAATGLWSVEVVIAKRLLRRLAPATVGLARMVGGSVLLVGWALARGGVGWVARMGWAGWGWALLTGVLLAGYVASWLTALSRAQAVDVTAVLVAAVPVTAALQVVVAGGRLDGQLVGLALVLLGSAAAVLASARRTGGPAPRPAADPTG